jgi:Lipase (class 3)
MPLNKVAAAYLAYFAYIDDALDVVPVSDFRTLLAQIPAGVANGPWKLCWGPAVNNGTLGYVAQGADGTYGLAFRGTNVDGSLSTAFWNVLEDADGFALVPWLYPQQPGAPLQISAGIDTALALAIGMTDPATSVSLLDYLRGLAKSGPLDLMVTGHSLGAALVVVATAWLNDQLAKVEPLKFSLWPHTFAAPTMWNDAFAKMFVQPTYTYYAAVNTNDIVPMGWANLDTALNTYPSPGPSLFWTDALWYGALSYAQGKIQQSDYTEITPSNLDSFTQMLDPDDWLWTTEAGEMHSMQFVYFPFATGTTAPILPNTTRTGVAHPRIAVPA